MAELKNFLDSEGRLTAWPAKRKMKLQALVWLAGKLEPGKTYMERELNAQLNSWHTFGDPVTLRRELVDHHFLGRTSYGSSYWMEPVQPTLEDIEKLYG